MKLTTSSLTPLDSATGNQSGPGLKFEEEKISVVTATEALAPLRVGSRKAHLDRGDYAVTWQDVDDLPSDGSVGTAASKLQYANLAVANYVNITESLKTQFAASSAADSFNVLSLEPAHLYKYTPQSDSTFTEEDLSGPNVYTPTSPLRVLCAGVVYELVGDAGDIKTVTQASGPYRTFANVFVSTAEQEGKMPAQAKVQRVMDEGHQMVAPDGLTVMKSFNFLPALRQQTISEFVNDKGTPLYVLVEELGIYIMEPGASEVSPVVSWDNLFTMHAVVRIGGVADLLTPYDDSTFRFDGGKFEGAVGRVQVLGVPQVVSLPAFPHFTMIVLREEDPSSSAPATQEEYKNLASQTVTLTTMRGQDAHVVMARGAPDRGNAGEYTLKALTVGGTKVTAVVTYRVTVNNNDTITDVEEAEEVPWAHSLNLQLSGRHLNQRAVANIRIGNGLPDALGGLDTYCLTYQYRPGNIALGELDIYRLVTVGTVSRIGDLQPYAAQPYRQNFKGLRVEGGEDSLGTESGALTVAGGVGVTGDIHCQSCHCQSDSRLKSAIVGLTRTDCLSIVRRLNPVSWRWRSNGAVDTGFIAQDVASVLPDCVRTDSTSGTLTLNYNTLFTHVTGAVQEIAAELEELKCASKRQRII